MIRFIYFIILVMLYACSSKEGWTQFYAKGIQEDHDSYSESYSDLIFINDSIGYLGGSKMIKTGNNKFIFKTILYQTNSQGKLWEQIPLDYSGSVQKIFVFQDTLILLLQDLPSNTDSNYILQSVNKGKSWKKLFNYSSKNYVRDIHFTRANYGKIIFDKGNERQLLTYQNNEWETVLTLPQNVYGDHIYKDQLISIVPEGNTANARGILITETKSPKTKEIRFDNPYFIYSVFRGNNELLLAVQEKSNGKIIKYSNNQIQYLSFGKYPNYIPEQIFASGNKIMAIVFRENPTILGTTHSLLLSEDNGKTWILEELPSLRYKPAFLYRNHFFIIYTLPVEFQLRTF